MNSGSALSSAQKKTRVYFKLAAFKADELNMGQIDILQKQNAQVIFYAICHHSQSITNAFLTLL